MLLELLYETSFFRVNSLNDETTPCRQLKKDVKLKISRAENKIREEVVCSSDSGLSVTLSLCIIQFCDDACLTIILLCVEGMGAQ